MKMLWNQVEKGARMQRSLYDTFATQVVVPVEARSLKPVDAPSQPSHKLRLIQIPKLPLTVCAEAEFKLVRVGSNSYKEWELRGQGNRQFTANGRHHHKKCSLLLAFNSREQAFGKLLPRW